MLKTLDSVVTIPRRNIPLRSTSRRSFLQLGFSLVGLSLFACGAEDKDASPQLQPKTAQEMKLESSAFEANGMIPVQYTCDGQDISPPLSWDTPPAGTQSLALIVDDPDAPGGTFVHWVAYNLSADSQQLPEAVLNQNFKGGAQGKSSFGKLGYGGPCPPKGTHRYFFKLYALDQKLGLEPGKTKEQVLQAMEGHVLATSELIGRYQRQS